MKECTIYLAGKMSGISYESSNEWRLMASEWLSSQESKYNVKTINPNDYYNFLTKTYKTEKEIIRFDLHKVRTSDLILVNLNGQSTGTNMEIQHAFDNGIPIIGYKTDDEELHPWLDFECDRVCCDLKEALEFIRDYYLK